MAKAKQELSKKEELELEVGQLLTEEQALERTASELAAANPKFIEFLKQQKEFKEKSDAFWKKLEGDMIEHNVKSLKSPAWGSITIAEKKIFSPAEKDFSGIPPKFIKKALDTTKINAQLKLSGKLPKGINAKDTQYLTKKIKIKEINEE